MKKLFTKVGIVLLITSSASPLVACSFNFYVNRAANAIARSFADQTSSVLKSLVMSKVIDSDTNSTNDDIMKQTKNGSIVNASNGQTVNNWGEFANKWGSNGNIETNGFDASTYFKGTGTGTLTKNVNTRRTITNGFNTASRIRLLTAFNNPTLYSLAIAPNGIAHGPIVEFLKTLQGNLADKPATLQLAINLINNYDTDFIPEISRLMGGLVNGEWDTTGQKTPNDLSALKNFIINSKDNSYKPYSAWVNGTDWKLNSGLTPTLIALTTGHALDSWSQDDFNLYRGGSLINYLFWKISSDHSEIINPVPPVPPVPAPRYFGDVLSDHIDTNNNIDTDGLLKDISQFIPFLLSNPLYPLLIIEGIIPIIKKWILKMPDITLGVKHLIVGDIPTNQTTQSFNLLDIANTIKNLVNSPEQLKSIIKKLLGWSGNDKTLDTFTYDIKIGVTAPMIGKVNAPLGSILNSTYIDHDIKNSLVDSAAGFLTSDKVKNTVDMIVNLITQLGNQYPAGKFIDIDLVKTKLFLLEATNGLLNKLTTAMVTLKDIIKNNDPIQDSRIEQLYVDLGGNKPGTNYNIFTPDLPIDILEKAMLDQNSELTKILNLMFGTTADTDKKLGLSDIISNFNNQWIKTNYEDYFDVPNTKLGHTYNISMQRNTVNNTETINLKYDFNYTINGTTYHFVVTLIDSEDLNTFQGIRNFKFKTITLSN
ncbi:hypothetical protein [Spiroplasma sp. AdecLV25b]|uniref:hypothetical protein n=1 Tax=Spiroplasma sp. AdecLV25b TaxID=3027162 RepID=UPI0027DFE43D|nr:hypothetical protein [Spiroplasma sp. AdecLV25b]